MGNETFYGDRLSITRTKWLGWIELSKIQTLEFYDHRALQKYLLYRDKILPNQLLVTDIYPVRQNIILTK